jgi:hypothetical protein
MKNELFRLGLVSCQITIKVSLSEVQLFHETNSLGAAADICPSKLKTEAEMLITAITHLRVVIAN